MMRKLRILWECVFCSREQKATIQAFAWGEGLFQRPTLETAMDWDRTSRAFTRYEI